MDAKKIILVTGGIRSGKSRYALSLAQKVAGKKMFIATGQGFDEGMAQRIKKHREERGEGFLTIEEPLYLAEAMKAIPQDMGVVLIDCLTLWVNNLLYYFKDDHSQVRQQLDFFLRILASPPTHVIIVTNEIGLGVTPENELARTFVDELGFINQRVAQLSDEVTMMVAGLPRLIKGVQPYAAMDYSLTEHPSFE